MTHSKIVLGLMLAMAAGGARAQTTPRVEDLPDPLESDQRQILAQITDYALKYAQELPDFVCAEVTRHNVDSKGLRAILAWLARSTASSAMPATKEPTKS
jgi:hypothetical protein